MNSILISSQFLLLLLLLLQLSCVEVEGITRNCITFNYPSASCSVGEIRLAKSLTRVQDGAFSYSSISGYLPIKSPIRVLENGAFASTSLKTVKIGNTVTDIGIEFESGNLGKYDKMKYDVLGVFEGNADLEKLTFDEPSALTNIGYRAFANCYKLAGDLVVPDSVQVLQYGAFFETLLSSVVIGTGVTKTGRINDMIKGPSLFDNNDDHNDDWYVYPAGVFQEVHSLKSLTFKEPSQVQSIGAFDFFQTNLVGELIIPDSVTEIGRHAFGDLGGAYWFDDDSDDAASLVVTIGTGLEVLSAFGSQFMKGVFEGSRNVVEVIFKEPSKVTMIGANAFSGCNLSSLIIPDSVIEIQYKAFLFNEYLKSVTVGTGLTKMGSINDISLEAGQPFDNVYSDGYAYGVFYACERLKTLIFKEPSSLKEIGQYDFWLTSIEGDLIIPDSVTKVGKAAFANYANYFYMRPLPPCYVTIGSGLIELGTVYDKLGIFHHKGNIQTVTFKEPSSLTLIGRWAFCRNNITGTLILPDSVEVIARGAFWGNKYLEEVIISTGMKQIGLINEMIVGSSGIDGGKDYYEYTNIRKGIGPFAACSSLETLTFNQPSTVREIGDWAFYDTRLKGNLILPDSLEELGKGAFSGSGVGVGSSNTSTSTNTDLHVTVGIGLKILGGMADSSGVFENNTNLKTLTFKEPSQVESIGSRAFKGCSRLEVVIVPPSVVRIGNEAFYDTNLKEIYITSTTSSYNTYGSYHYTVPLFSNSTNDDPAINDDPEANELVDAIDCSTGVKVFLIYGSQVQYGQIDALTEAGCTVYASNPCGPEGCAPNPCGPEGCDTEDPTEDPTEEPTNEPNAVVPVVVPVAAPTPTSTSTTTHAPVTTGTDPVPSPVASPDSTATGGGGEGGGGVPTIPVTSDTTNTPELKFAYTLILRNSPTSALTAAQANELEEWAAKTLSIERKNIVVYSSADLKIAKRKHLEELFFLVAYMDIRVRSNEAFYTVNDLFLEKLRGDMFAGDLGVDKDMELVAIMPYDSNSETTTSSNEAAPTMSPSAGAGESVGDESTSSSSSSSSSSGGTSDGGIAGIVIGALVAACALGGGLYYYNSSKNSRKATADDTTMNEVHI